MKQIMFNTLKPNTGPFTGAVPIRRRSHTLRTSGHSLVLPNAFVHRCEEEERHGTTRN